MGRFMLALVTLRWCAHARRPRHIGNFSRLLQRKLEQAAECYEQALKMKLEVLGTGHRCAWAAAAAAASAAAPVTPVKTVADEQGNQGVVASTMQPTATFTLLPLAPHTHISPLLHTHAHMCSETSNSMYHLAEVRWQQGQHDAAVRLMEHSLEIMEAQVGSSLCSDLCLMAFQVAGCRLGVHLMEHRLETVDAQVGCTPGCSYCPAACPTFASTCCYCGPTAVRSRRAHNACWSRPSQPARCLLPSMNRAWVRPPAACGGAAASLRCCWSGIGWTMRRSCCATSWAMWSPHR